MNTGDILFFLTISIVNLFGGILGITGTITLRNPEVAPLLILIGAVGIFAYAKQLLWDSFRADHCY